MLIKALGKSSGSGLVDILRAGRIVEPGSCMVYLIAESTNCVQGVPVVARFETPDGSVQRTVVLGMTARIVPQT